MTDLYRRLLTELTERFGGTIDEANADAIAYAAAELYHRDFEPRLWEERSAHDLLDLFGVPRAGTFAPFSLSDRLVLFQNRSSQAQYVSRAHELLDELGVARKDAEGKDQSLKWRLDQIAASAAAQTSGDTDEAAPPAVESEEAAEAKQAEDGTEGAAKADAEVATGPDPAEDAAEQADEAEGAEAAAPGSEAAEATPAEEPAEAAEDLGLVDNTSSGNGLAGDAPVTVDTPDAEGDERPAEGDEQPAEGAAGPAESDLEPAEDEADAPAVPSPAAVNGSDGDSDGQPTPSEAVAAVLSSGLADDSGDKPAEPSAAQVAEAVRALEEAAQVEADMAKAPESAGSVDLVQLTETLNGIHSEIAAVRELVEAFEIGMRRQLDELQAQMAAIQANGQSGAPALGTSAPPGHDGSRGPALITPSGSSDPTGPLPTMPGDSAASSEDLEPVKEHRTVRRVLLVVLLLVLGVLLAGGVALIAAVGWDSLRDQSVGLIL